MRTIPHRIFLACALFACIATFATPRAYCADESPRNPMLPILKLAAQDLKQYADKGDTGLKKILEAHGLDKEIDWESYSKDPDKTSDLLHKITGELMAISETNSNAKAIVEKYDAMSRDNQIRWLYQSLVKDVALYANGGDAEMKTLLQKDGVVLDTRAYATIPSATFTPAPADPSSPSYAHDVTNALQTLAMDLLDLSKRNAHAKEIVEKYKIMQSPQSPERPPASSTSI